jgi:hypothetical protein
MTKKSMLMLSGLSAALLVALPALADSMTTLTVTSGPSTLNGQTNITGNLYLGGVLANPTTIDSDGEDVSATHGTGVLIVGDTFTGQPQIGIDTNEIQARSGGAGSTLYVQHAGGNLQLASGGGDVTIGSSASDVTVPGVTNFEGATFFNQIADFQEWVEFNFVTEFYYTAKFYAAVGLSSTTTIPDTAGSGSQSHLCRENASGNIVTCSSSRRFKKDIADLDWGLREVMAMKPVSFSWIGDGQSDLGFIAEDAFAVVPELVERDENGDVKGFNYAHYTAVLTHAVQEQQKTIEDQRVELTTTQQAVALRDREIAKLQTEVSELQKLRDEVKALSRAVASMSPRP